MYIGINWLEWNNILYKIIDRIYTVFQIYQNMMFSWLISWCYTACYSSGIWRVCYLQHDWNEIRGKCNWRSISFSKIFVFRLSHAYTHGPILWQLTHCGIVTQTATWLTMADSMACCRMAFSHHLNHRWSIDILEHSYVFDGIMVCNGLVWENKTTKTVTHLSRYHQSDVTWALRRFKSPETGRFLTACSVWPA